MPDDIYQSLRESHEIQRSLCRRLLRAKPGDSLRDELFSALHIELAAHAAAEERFFYAPVMMDDMGLALCRHALAEHHEIDECVEALHKLNTDGDAWLDQAKRLSEKVHHHLKEEEKKFFQLSGKVLTETQKNRLAGRYRRDYARMRRTLEEGA